MLIVSKFHDYYDVGMKSGVDKTIVYDRQTIAVNGKFPPISRYDRNCWDCAVIAFCGKFYPFIFHVTSYEVDKILWTLEEALSTLNFEKKGYRLWDEYSLTSEAGVKKFFEKKYPELEEIFHQYRTPIFGFEPVLERTYSWSRKRKYDSLVINPNLKTLQFYKVKDPIEAFQDIYTFMSGVIGAPPKKEKPIDDKIMAASKGHDGEYSFKKTPGKRGKNKWR